MEPVAAIVAGPQLVRLLSHLGLPIEFPKTKSARSPPLPLCEEPQIDLAEGYPEEMPLPHVVGGRPSVDAAEGIDEDRGWHAA